MNAQHLDPLTAKPVDLFIGRHRTRITEPVRLEVQIDLESHFYHDMPFNVPVSQSHQFFISDKLFASVRVFAKHRYSRAPIKIVKPKRGPLQIHFVKKYVTLY